MAEGGTISEYGNRTKVQNDLQTIYKLIRRQHKTLQVVAAPDQCPLKDVIRSLAMNESQIIPEENGKRQGQWPRARRTSGPAATALQSPARWRPFPSCT